MSSLSPSSRNSAISRDPLAVPLALPGGPRQPQPGGEEARLGQGVPAEHEVLGHRLGARQRDVLEGPGDAEPAIWYGRIPVSTVSPKRTSPGRGLVDAGEDVEHRRLAGAVGADDGVHRAGLRRVNDTSESALTRAEPDADVVDLERSHVGAEVGPGSARRVRPARRAHAVHRVSVLVPDGGRGGRRAASRRRRGRGRGAARRRSGPARRPSPDSDTSPTSRTKAGSATPRAMVAFCSTSRTDGALAVDLADHLADLADDARREAQRGLVEEQQLRAGHQAAADRQHLLLAAGEQAGRAARAGRRGPGTARRRALCAAPCARPVPAAQAAGPEVLLHREPGEDAPSLRHLDQADARRSGPGPGRRGRSPPKVTRPRSTRPRCSRRVPEMVRSRVVLPAPLLPRTATTLPSATSRSTPRSARTVPP